jgi:hypothetical protein
MLAAAQGSLLYDEFSFTIAKAKRALFVDVVAVAEMAMSMLLYCLPIDKQNESKDFSGIRV